MLLSWLRAPAVSMELGRSVLVEMPANQKLNVQVGISYEAAGLELGVRHQSWARSEAPTSVEE